MLFISENANIEAYILLVLSIEFCLFREMYLMLHFWFQFFFMLYTFSSWFIVCSSVLLVLFHVILCLWFVPLDADILCMKHAVEYQFIENDKEFGWPNTVIIIIWHFISVVYWFILDKSSIIWLVLCILGHIGVLHRLGFW